MTSMRAGAVLLSLILCARASLAAEAGIRIDGHVVDSRARPIAGAHVELQSLPSRYEMGLQEAGGRDSREGSEPAVQGVTRADGRFELLAPGPGLWRIVADAEGFVPMVLPLLPLLADTSLLPVELPDDAGLRVRVVDPEGKPLAGAQVRGEAWSRLPQPDRGGWEPRERHGWTGRDGFVRLPRTPGESLQLWAIALHHPVQARSENATASARIQLSPGARWLVEASDHRGPVANAVVRSFPGDFVLGRTGQDGRLSVILPATGEAALVVEAADGRRISHRWQSADRPAASPRVLSLPAVAALAGQVLDRESRHPLAGALVWPSNDPGRWLRADARGAFRLQGISLSGQTGLEATATDHFPAFFPLPAGASRGQALLTLAPSGFLNGTVMTARGRPVADAEVRISRQPGGADTRGGSFRTRSSAGGTFRVPGLEPGAGYAIVATCPGFAPASSAVSIPRLGAAAPALRLILRRGRTTSGLVVDATGRPLGKARVELFPSLAGRVLPAASAVPKSAASHRTETGTDGRFQLPHLPAGWFDLRIVSPGFAPFAGTVEVPEGAGTIDLGRFLLARGEVFRGWVSDSEGKPIAGAEVWRIPEPVPDWLDLYKQGPAAVTGLDGTFLLPDLPPDQSFGLDICRRGFLPVSAIVREITVEPYRAVLQPAARIAGRVLDPRGSPVSGSRVDAWLLGDKPDKPESYRPCLRGGGAATSKEDGRFVLDDLPPGWWNLRATADGYLAAATEKLHVLAGESFGDVEISLDEGAVVTGQILDPEGEPAAGARVSLHSGAAVIRSTAVGDGAYRLAGIEPGEQWVEADGDDGAWGKQRLVVRPGENRLDLTLDQGARRQEIRGRVLGPQGSPVAGATVLAASASQAFTAEDGSFALAVEDNSAYVLQAKKEGLAAGRAPEAIRVEGAAVEGVEIRLDAGVAIAGRLLGLDREDLAVAAVEVELAPPFKSRAALDAQGRYRLEDLPPGEWTVLARVGERLVRERVTLAPGALETALDLTFAPAWDVSGWILGPDGEPVAGAFVRFAAPGNGGSMAHSRSDGSFRLKLEDGTYRVWSMREGYSRAVLEEPVVVSGGPQEGVEVRMGEAAVLYGRILGLEPGERADKVWAEAAGGNLRPGELDQEGGFRISGLTSGDWKVIAAFGGQQASGEVSVQPGQREATIDLLLSR